MYDILNIEWLMIGKLHANLSYKVLNCYRDFVAIIVENCRQMQRMCHNCSRGHSMNIEVAAKIAVLDNFLKPGFLLYFFHFEKCLPVYVVKSQIERCGRD